MFDYVPDKITLVSNNALKLLQKLLHYKIVIIDPNKYPKNKYVELIYARFMCPKCGKQLLYNDLWYNKKEKKVALIRICHNCCILFLLSGRFNDYDSYLKSYDFYNEIYSKNKEQKRGK